MLQYNKEKADLTRVKKKLKTVEEDLDDARDRLLDTQPAEMFDISNLNEENDRLFGENRKLMRNVEEQKREMTKRDEEKNRLAKGKDP